MKVDEIISNTKRKSSKKIVSKREPKGSGDELAMLKPQAGYVKGDEKRYPSTDQFLKRQAE